MAKIASFRDLVAWQKSMDLADMIYDLTDRFPAPPERTVSLSRTSSPKSVA